MTQSMWASVLGIQGRLAEWCSSPQPWYTGALGQTSLAPCIWVIITSGAAYLLLFGLVLLLPYPFPGWQPMLQEHHALGGVFHLSSLPPPHSPSSSNPSGTPAGLGRVSTTWTPLRISSLFLRRVWKIINLKLRHPKAWSWGSYSVMTSGEVCEGACRLTGSGMTGINSFPVTSAGNSSEAASDKFLQNPGPSQTLFPLGMKCV